MIDRRAFLKSGGVALFTLGAGPSFLARAALAAPGPGSFGRRKTLVTMMAVPPRDAAGLFPGWSGGRIPLFRA
jgi:hypothetical protein